MAVSIVPKAENEPASAVEFLDVVHPIFEAQKAAWERDERRLYGGDAVLDELEQWSSEDADHYADRMDQATYVNFPQIHASTLVGHLRRSAPSAGKGYNFGQMGEVRERVDIDRPSLAELTWYNVDGIGQDGSQWPSWWDAVQERACATGHRWIMVEKPAGPLGRKASQADVLAGFRAYAVEYSPLDVPYWHYQRGVLQMAIIRTPVGFTGAQFGADGPSPMEQPNLGYYLLVRKGYRGLDRFDTRYSAGGWWIFDASKEEIDSGSWNDTNGAIPFFAFYSLMSKGAPGYPAISRSLTMELGQLAVGLMNRLSERDYDAADAAKSVKYILGANKESFNLTVEYHESGQIVIPVLPHLDDSGRPVIPQIYDSSNGAVAAEVFKTIIDGKITEAYEMMARQHVQSAGPNSSDAARQSGFAEGKSPLLARLAANREQAENIFLYFCAQRNGIKNPTASATWPRDFDLRPIIADITEILTMEKLTGIRSKTFDAMVLRKGAEDRNLFDDAAQADKVETEWQNAEPAAQPLSGQEQKMLGGTQTSRVPTPAG